MKVMKKVQVKKFEISVNEEEEKIAESVFVNGEPLLTSWEQDDRYDIDIAAIDFYKDVRHKALKAGKESDTVDSVAKQIYETKQKSSEIEIARFAFDVGMIIVQTNFGFRLKTQLLMGKYGSIPTVTSNVYNQSIANCDDAWAPLCALIVFGAMIFIQSQS